MKEKKYLSRLEVSKELHVHKYTLYLWHKNGKLVPEYINPYTHRTKYSVEQVEEFKKKYRD